MGILIFKVISKTIRKINLKFKHLQYKRVRQFVANKYGPLVTYRFLQTYYV